jgi:hypothetical protein
MDKLVHLNVRHRSAAGALRALKDMQTVFLHGEILMRRSANATIKVYQNACLGLSATVQFS